MCSKQLLQYHSTVATHRDKRPRTLGSYLVWWFSSSLVDGAACSFCWVVLLGLLLLWVVLLFLLFPFGGVVFLRPPLGLWCFPPCSLWAGAVFLRTSSTQRRGGMQRDQGKGQAAPPDREGRNTSPPNKREGKQHFTQKRSREAAPPKRRGELLPSSSFWAVVSSLTNSRWYFYCITLPSDKILFSTYYVIADDSYSGSIVSILNISCDVS